MGYIEYDGKEYNERHGGPFDRGGADSYYGRRSDPHYYLGGTGTSQRIGRDGMTMEEIEAYHAGYDYNEEMGYKKEW
jgi:hypothetical protein